MAELRFDITGNSAGAQRSTRDLAGSMDVAARGARLLAESLDKQKRAAAASAGATIAAAKADKILADASEESIAAFVAEKEALDRDTRAKEENAAASAAAGASASSMVSPMGALVGIGVGLAPVIATVTAGLGGLGLAAISVIKNQQLMARTLAPLKTEFASFSKSLQPEVLQVFNAAIADARPLLRGLQPVAAATGKALAGSLGQIGDTFRSGEWQQFFGFMAKTAGPDVRLLGRTLIDLANDLPPLLELLQPVARAMLLAADAAAKLAAPVIALGRAAQAGTEKSFSIARALDQWTVSITNHLPGGKAINDQLTGFQHSASGAADQTHQLTAVQQQAATAAQLQKQAVTDLTNALNGQVNALLAAQGGQVAWKQAQQASTQAIKDNKNSLDGNSASALAARQALIQSSSAALTYAQSEITLHHNVNAASAIINNQIAYLQSHAGHSRVATAEIYALVASEAKLPRSITSKVHVDDSSARDRLAGLQRILSILDGKVVTTYVSTVYVKPGSTAQGRVSRRAGGGLIPGHGTGDTVPALLTPGEVVVPKGMVSAGAVDHLRGMLPGFAAGGKVRPLSQRLAEALHDARHHPGHPREFDRLTGQLATASHHVAADRDLLRLGHLNAEHRRQTEAALRSDLAHRAALRHRIRPLAGERQFVTGVAGDLAGRDGDLRSAIADAQRRHLPGVAHRLRGQLTTGVRQHKELTDWLDKVHLQAAAAAKQKKDQQAAKTAAAATAAAAQQAAAAVAAAASANTATIGSYLAFAGPGFLSGSTATAGRALSAQTFDQGGYLRPGMTIAVNNTGRPEAVVPGGGVNPGGPVVLEVHGASEADHMVAELIRKYVRVRGGSVQKVLGRAGVT